MNEEKFAKVSGTGSFLPGDPVPFDKIEDYLGEVTGASNKVMKWMLRTKSGTWGSSPSRVRSSARS